MPDRGMTADEAGHGEPAHREPHPEAVSWLIVGGGIHGTYLSRYLTGRIGVPPGEVRVLDPYPEPLHRWKHCTANTGMEMLRSPAPHHLDMYSLSLKRFAAELERTGRTAERDTGHAPAGSVPYLNPPYDRPSLELFNLHADRVIREHGLDTLRILGRARRLGRENGLYRLEYEIPEDVGRGARGAGSPVLYAEHVILAIGMAEEPYVPGWAAGFEFPEVFHIFDARFSLRALCAGLSQASSRIGKTDRQENAGLPGGTENTDRSVAEKLPGRIVVVGAGSSGAQCAAAIAKTVRTCGAGTRVTLLTERPLSVHLFDSDREWQGKNRMSAFAAVADPAERRRIIAEARHKGSVTPETAREIERETDSGTLELLTARVTGMHRRASPGASGFRQVPERGSARLELETDHGNVSADLVILATGFTRRRPGGEWLDRAVRELGLPTAPDGFPVPDRHLQWAPGLFVTGALAELELGPVSRNISGVHRAAVRIASYLYRS